VIPAATVSRRSDASVREVRRGRAAWYHVVARPIATRRGPDAHCVGCQRSIRRTLEGVLSGGPVWIIGDFALPLLVAAHVGRGGCGGGGVGEHGGRTGRAIPAWARCRLGGCLGAASSPGDGAHRYIFAGHMSRGARGPLALGMSIGGGEDRTMPSARPRAELDRPSQLGFWVSVATVVVTVVTFGLAVTAVPNAGRNCQRGCVSPIRSLAR
jgi:hypothetical protein